MATVTFEVDDELLQKAQERLARDNAELQTVLRNRIFEMAHATPLWNFREEMFTEEMIEDLGHIGLRGMMSR